MLADDGRTITTTTLTFPKDLLRLLYWVFFKPVTLDRYIHKIDPTLGTDPSLLTLWRRGHDKPELRNLVAPAFFHILITPWFLGAFLAWVLSLLGIPVSWFGVAVGVGLGVAVGAVFGLLFGVAGGVALGMAVGVGVGVAVGVVFDLPFGVAVGVTFGVASGVTFGVARGVAVGVTLGVASGVVLGVAVGVALGVVLGGAGSVVVGVAGGVVVGVASGVACGVAFIVGYFRLFLYIVELPWSFMLSRLAYVGENALALFRLSPVKWDELIWLPLLGTGQHLVAISQENREVGKEEIAFVGRSFRQSWAARNALVELTARDLEGTDTLESTAAIADKLAWLPPELPGELEAVLPAIRQVAQRVQAALESDTLYNRREQLQRARDETLAVRQSLSLGRAARIASRFGPILAEWQAMLERAVAALEAEEVALALIPNVYVAGGPLATASKVFKGRSDLFLTLERELTGPAEQRPTVLLYGPRRSGKTSVLRQLPVRLGPDFIPVEIDLQSGITAEEAAGLLYYLARQITENALLHRRIRLPTLKREDLIKEPYMAFLEWLGEAEKAVGQRLILLNLDEYERLEETLEAGRLDQRIFHLLRSLIQHHPSLVVLLSGSHTLEDLAPFWSDYLINVRVLRVGPLEEAAARELIVKPIPDFPLEYEEEAVAKIITATGRQPYLIQATCRDLVNYLNQQRRRHAILADAEWALGSCLTSGVAYFQELWAGRDTDDLQRATLLSIARNRGGMLSEKVLSRRISYPGLRDALRRLQHRQILMPVDGQYCFQAELVRRWVQQQA